MYTLADAPLASRGSVIKGIYRMGGKNILKPSKGFNLKIKELKLSRDLSEA